MNKRCKTCLNPMMDKDACTKCDLVTTYDMHEPEDNVKKQLLDALAKEPTMVLSTAYVYAKNLTLYGEDVTEKWLTAIQNASALEKAYRKGYYDALQRQAESEE